MVFDKRFRRRPRLLHLQLGQRRQLPVSELAVRFSRQRPMCFTRPSRFGLCHNTRPRALGRIGASGDSQWPILFSPMELETSRSAFNPQLTAQQRHIKLELYCGPHCYYGPNILAGKMHWDVKFCSVLPAMVYTALGNRTLGALDLPSGVEAHTLNLGTITTQPQVSALCSR